MVKALLILQEILSADGDHVYPFMVTFLEAHFLGGNPGTREEFQPFCFHWTFLISFLKFSSEIQFYSHFFCIYFTHSRWWYCWKVGWSWDATVLPIVTHRMTAINAKGTWSRGRCKSLFWRKLKDAVLLVFCGEAFMFNKYMRPSCGFLRSQVKQSLMPVTILLLGSFL